MCNLGICDMKEREGQKNVIIPFILQLYFLTKYLKITDISLEVICVKNHNISIIREHGLKVFVLYFLINFIQKD